MTDTINAIKEVVSDKEKLMVELLRQIEAGQAALDGLDKAIPTLQTNESEANTRKMLATTMKIVRRQQEVNRTLLSVVVMLCGSRDFTRWQAELAMKLGSDPGEVLQKMIRDKLAGKG